MREWMTTLEDGSIRVCCESGGIEACTVVSSMHLVYAKRPQLRRRVNELAREAFAEASY